MRPMVITIITRSIHMLAAPTLILGWQGFAGLGITGAAIVNLFAHSLAAVLGLGVLFTGRSRLRLTLANFRLDLPIVWRILRIGVPALVMTVQRSLSYLVLTRLMVPFGTVALAAHSLIQRVDTVLFLPSWALSSGAGVLVGQNLGAGHPGRAERNAWLAVGLVEVLMVAGAAAALTWSGDIIRLFNTDPALVEAGGRFLRIAAAGYVVMSLMVVLQQALSGAGDTAAAMLISIAMVWLAQIPLAYLLPRVTDLGVDGIRWAIAISIGFGAAVNVVYFRLGRWKRRRV